MSSKKSTRYSRQILMQLDFFRQTFEKHFQTYCIMEIRVMGTDLFYMDVPK
jgi:hypothetical protein